MRPGRGWLIAVASLGTLTLNPFAIPAGLVCGYGSAWVGHFIIEKNRPATFRYPWYSLLGDVRMFVDVLRGRVSLR